MEIKIESASIRMLDKFSEIENQCFDEEAFSKRQLAYLLSDYNSIGLVAKADGEVAGFIISQVEVEDGTLFGHIITVNVASNFRQKGIATLMLKETEQILKNKGIGECRLEVREDNFAALKLYEGNGYRRSGRLEGYYGKKNGLFLKKHL